MQNNNPRIVETAARSTKRRNVAVENLAVADLWHIAQRIKNEQDRQRVLEVWHLAQDMLDKLVTLNLAATE